MVIFMVGGRVFWWDSRNSTWLSERVLCIGLESQEVFSVETRRLVSSKSVSSVFGRENIKKCSSVVVSGPTASESSRELTQNTDF